MGNKSKIEWTDASWNPVTGCTPVSEGCANCYAERIARRFAGRGGYPERPEHFRVTLHDDRLGVPLRWRKPRMIFVCSQGDLFHDDVPFEFVDRVFSAMALSPRHTFQVLTKRPGRMQKYLRSRKPDPGEYWPRPVWLQMHVLDGRMGGKLEFSNTDWPLKNVWLGVTVENQEMADERIPALLRTPAAMRFVSVEPMLGAVKFNFIGCPECGQSKNAWFPNYTICRACGKEVESPPDNTLDWVICGGESGPGARPMHPEWVRSLRDHCKAADVPFMFKQWGEYLPTPVYDAPGMAGGRAFNLPAGGRCAAIIRERGGPFRSGEDRVMIAGDANGHGIMLDDHMLALRVGKKAAGRLLDGVLHDEYPEVSRG